MDVMNGMPGFMDTGTKKSGASDWLIFLNTLITDDCVDRVRGSLEADIKECRESCRAYQKTTCFREISGGFLYFFIFYHNINLLHYIM